MHGPISDQMLVVTDDTIRQHARGDVLRAVVGQFVREQGLRLRGVQFRTAHEPSVRAAYGAMNPQEFDDVNARQEWANWRTVPRGMSGRVPNRPLQVLDLGCGTGGSTAVLACFCPPGSQIVGLELNPEFVHVADTRSYRCANGQPAAVRFRCQSISERFCSEPESPFPDASIDLVNACGVIGHHLERPAVEWVVAEVARVLRRDAIALIDCGPRLRPQDLAELSAPRGLQRVDFVRANQLDLNGQLVLRRT